MILKTTTADATIIKDSSFQSLSEDAMWEAVQSRDPRFYSTFVYAVKSSKIFCRPTCASRKPARNGVLFFSRTSDAASAGYRACLRCKPEESTKSLNGHAIERVCTFIEENYNSRISLSLLAGIAGQSQFHFHRSFRKATGVTPKEYVEAVRLKHLKNALRNGESTVRSTYRAGHNSSGWLYSGQAKLGMSPLEYKTGGEGVEIHYQVSNCTLGKLLVAGTEKGICFVCLGDSDQELLVHLENEYPNAEISRETSASDLNFWISRILNYLDGKTQLEKQNLPIDVAATAFQMSVWKELQNIPYGTTLSYNEVARKIGNPKAYRAVANACGANRVPLVIPCHRVVRKNGDIGGYRWGVDRKKKLLSMEAESK